MMFAFSGASEALMFLAAQACLLGVFSFFALFNYVYGLASLIKPTLRTTQPSGKRIAVVIVAYNEQHVIEATIRACDALTYPNRLLVVADDSSDPDAVARLRNLAAARGCQRVASHPFVQEIPGAGGGAVRHEPVEIWESSSFVFFHRPKNVGYKGGSLRKIQEYLAARGIEYLYLLDADWHPQPDVLEHCLAILEADARLAFVQTKRVSFPAGINLFQRYVAIVEEGCYYVDFAGRQALRHPVLFSGCCTLFRLDAVADVGGFTSGHLTEDLDLTNRFWLAGWRGVYAGHLQNWGELPFTYDDYRRQQERWAAGSARALREFLIPLLASRNLTFFHKLSAIRQNAYFATTLFTGAALALALVTVGWLVSNWNTYAAEFYLYVLSEHKGIILALTYWCVLSNLVEPLVMILVHKRSPRDLLHIPVMIWYTWSVIPTYVLGNLKGLFGAELHWFRTPKFARGHVGSLSRIPKRVRLFNRVACLVLFGLYFTEGWLFGWFDEFALILLPASLIVLRRNA